MGTDLVSFKRNLGALIDRGELALPSTVAPEAFKNAAIVAFQTNPQIRNGTPESVFTALRHIAGSGLMPDGREAAIVIYGGKAQAQPMVAGLRKIARNSGQVSAMWDDVIYEGEEIVYKFVDGLRTWEHVNEDGSPIKVMKRGGKIIGAYAAAKLKDGTVEMEPMTLEQIEKRRKASPNQKGPQPTGVWKDWFEEMARKTAVRALCKRLPMSPEDYNRVEMDPTFREVQSARDVTPKETTEERLARIAAERRGETTPPDEAPSKDEPRDEPRDEAPHDPETGEVLDAVAFREEDVFPGDDAFTEGVRARHADEPESACPYAENPSYSNWVGGWREAGKAMQ